MRPMLALAAALPLLAPVSVSADVATSITGAEIARSYGVNSDRDETATALARLKEVCSSNKAGDKARCARAWRLIHEAKARRDAGRTGQ